MSIWSAWRNRYSGRSITITTTDGIWTATGLSNKQTVAFIEKVYAEHREKMLP